MTRLAQTARLLKVANDEARPFFQPSLRFLVTRAIDTADHRSAVYADYSTSEEQMHSADDAADEAKKALLDHLLTHHAIGRDLAAKLGAIL